jgi:hypothetical protein
MRCEPADELPDGRLVVYSADRNRGPILKVLERVLPKTGLVLEIASGTGQHVVHFAQALKGLSWQPTDMDAACRRSISASPLISTYVHCLGAYPHSMRSSASISST